MIKAFLIDPLLQTVELIELAMGERCSVAESIRAKIGAERIAYYASSDWDRIYYDQDLQVNGNSLCFKLPKNETRVFGMAVVVGMYLNTDEVMAEGPAIDVHKFKAQLRFFSKKVSDNYWRRLNKQHEFNFNEPEENASENV